MSVTTVNGPLGVRLTLNDRDAATPAMVEMRVGRTLYTATYDCAIECGELLGTNGEYRTLYGDAINWLEGFADQVAKTFGRARAGNPEYN